MTSSSCSQCGSPLGDSGVCLLCTDAPVATTPSPAPVASGHPSLPRTGIRPTTQPTGAVPEVRATAPASVKGFPATSSIVSPIIAGLHVVDQSINVVDEAASCALRAVPQTSPVLRIRFAKERHPREVRHRRAILSGTSPDGTSLYRLCDIRGDEAWEASWPHWRWEVAIRTDGFPSPSVRQLPPSWNDVRALVEITVTRYRQSQSGVDSAAALALFRHLVVERLRGTDPALLVAGGQHDWKDEWWPEPPAAADPEPGG